MSFPIASSALLLVLSSTSGEAALAHRMETIVSHATVIGHSPRGASRPGLSQSRDWGELAQVEPGTRLQVEERTGRTTKGRFVAVDDRTISLKVGSTVIQSDRAAVLRVTRADSPARRRALMGLLIGAAGGVVQALTTVETNKGPWALGLGLGWGAIGALFGGVSGHSARTVTTIYEAPPP